MKSEKLVKAGRIAWVQWTFLILFFVGIPSPLGTLGAGVEDQLDNRQEVQVVDTVTCGLCFDWRRSFAMGSELHFHNTASISPSGEFVAIAAEKTLSIYHLPAVCETRK